MKKVVRLAPGGAKRLVSPFLLPLGHARDKCASARCSQSNMKLFALCSLLLPLAPAGFALPAPAFCGAGKNLSVSVVTKFVSVRHADSEKVADLLKKALPDDPAEETSLQVVANPRTGKIFLLGPALKMDLAEAVIRAVDTDPPPPELAPEVGEE